MGSTEVSPQKHVGKALLHLGPADNTVRILRVDRETPELWFGPGDELKRNPEYPGDFPPEAFVKRTFSVEITKRGAPANCLGKLSYTLDGKTWLIPVSPNMLKDSTFETQEKNDSNKDFVIFRNSHPFADE